MGPDQHAFQETVRVRIQIDPVLEGSRLAFVGVYGHQRWTRLAHDRAPFSTRRKASAAKAAKPTIVKRRQQGLLAQLTGAQARKQLVAATFHIGIVADVAR